MARQEGEILAEAEAQVGRLLAELERFKSVTAQLEGATAGVDAAREAVISVSDVVRGLASQAQHLIEQLREVQPEAIRAELQSQAAAVSALRTQLEAVADRAGKAHAGVEQAQGELQSQAASLKELNAAVSTVMRLTRAALLFAILAFVAAVMMRFVPL